MYDEFEDDDLLMDYDDDLLYDEELEEMVYEDKVNEINDYWDRENEYIKNSGIYTKEEVKQILEEHNRIRNEKLAEAKKDYKDTIELIKDEKRLDAELREIDRKSRALERQIAIQGTKNKEYRDYRAFIEEQAAYDDFIASIDMADD